MIDITGLREDKRPQSSAIVHALLDRLEAAEKERDALRACIEAIKPVAWQTRTRPAWNDGTWGPWRKCSEEYAEDIKNTPLLHDWLYEARTLYTLPGAQQCKNCNGMGDRFDPSGEKIPCDLCESHLEEIRSLVAEAAHDIISGGDFWLSISLAAKKIYALPGAKGEKDVCMAETNFRPERRPSA